MEHYRINNLSGSYFIQREDNIPSLESSGTLISIDIIDICIDVLYTWGRHKGVGIKFYLLKKKREEIDLNEYELLKLIDILLNQGWNLRSGRFFKDYYFNSYPGAKEELRWWFPNGI